MTKRELAKMIDHTILKAEAQPADIKKLCAEAAEYGFASVCVNPVHVALAASCLKGTKVAVCTVIGFPLGATTSKIKAAEAELAIAEGAAEVDMVINIGALKAGDTKTVEDDVKAVMTASHKTKGVIVKVIVEACLLTDAEKETVCRLLLNTGADFVKTSTGFSTGGATVADVALFRRVVGDKMRIKAAGGVRTYEDAQKMIAAGADRLGSSNGVAIVSGM